MSTTVLGFKISMPIMIAPTAMQKMAHPEGNHCFSVILSALYRDFCDESLQIIDWVIESYVSLYIFVGQ